MSSEKIKEIIYSAACRLWNIKVGVKAKYNKSFNQSGKWFKLEMKLKLPNFFYILILADAPRI
jgi:hypothetical protein